MSPSVDEEIEDSTSQAVDRDLVRSITRWALLVTLGIVVFDMAILWNYPFPGSSTIVRGIVYTILGVTLILASLTCAFLGFRIVSMRVAPGMKRIYLIFLPVVAVVSSVVWLYLISPAG